MKIIYLISKSILNCDYLINKEIRYYSNFDFLIDTCLFSRNIEYSGNGGIIYCSEIISNMDLIRCIFFKCSCNNHGGAIWFVCHLSQGSNVKLFEVCASNCFSGNSYQFAIIILYSNSKSQFELLSLNKCNSIHTGSTSFLIQYGNSNLTFYNSSKNYNLRESGIYLAYLSKMESSFCSIINNNVSYERNIFLHDNSNLFLSFYNIINNNSPFNGVITNSGGISSIYNSIFLYNINNLFQIQSGEINLFNCNINHFINSIIVNNISFKLINISYNNTNTLQISHFNTIFCSFENIDLISTKKIFSKNIFFFIWGLIF